MKLLILTIFVWNSASAASPVIALKRTGWLKSKNRTPSGINIESFEQGRAVAHVSRSIIVIPRTANLKSVVDNFCYNNSLQKVDIGCVLKLPESETYTIFEQSINEVSSQRAFVKYYSLTFTNTPEALVKNSLNEIARNN